VVARSSELTLADAQALCAPYPGKNIIVGTDGDDVIDGTNKADCIVGGRGNDRIQGGNSDDVIFAGEGKDEVFGDNGADLIFAGAGDDTVAGGNGNDTLWGGVGNDRILGGSGDDILHGDDGADWLHGEDGTDTITGDNCNDRVIASQGIDAANGGAGTDICNGTACELPLTTSVCARNADCASGMRCVVASGICVPNSAENCESTTQLPDGGVGQPCTSTSTTDITCNGVDDDCNGKIDEDYLAQSVSCGVGACMRTRPTSCVGGTVVDACTPGTPTPTDATCDGVDDNCNGTSDEGFVSSGTSCGVGHCAAQGNMTCVNGAAVNSCVPGVPAPNDATCDATDDDCDGALDENYLTETISCGLGACATTGTRTCSGGMVVTSCTEGSGSDTDPICNGIDDDCDGRVDEEHEAQETTCGVGACASQGRTSCINGAEINSCTPGESAGSDASCDGIDSDCDGLVDEGYVSVPTQCGAGQCARPGNTRCVQGMVQNSCSPGSPAADDASCNGSDDDCDGRNDENYVARSVSCGAGACAALGTTTCTDGSETASCTPGTASSNDTSCNGIDDNCNGAVDEDYASVETSCGLGACRSTGTTSCAAGATIDSCLAGQPAVHDDTCNDVDDDCDGVFDEEFAGHVTSCGVGACGSAGATSCVRGVIIDSCSAGLPGTNDTSCNGIDDDCDSSTDEAFVSETITCGAGACAASGTTSCTQGQVVSSCTPGTAASNDSVCNAIDDDCNGAVDEDFAAAASSCGVGVCASAGTTACVAGMVTDSCRPRTGAPNDPTCDGRDDDCSGTADEDYVSYPTSCGEGACSANGASSCVGGVEVDSCVPRQAAATDESCDGIDDNCNGSVDEEFVPQSTNCGIGACIASGQTGCEGGQVFDGCTPGTPAEGDATCDGIDDDCGGAKDEDYQPVSTTCGVGLCAATGAGICVDGYVVDSCTPNAGMGDDSSCNGVDDNCNAMIDEGYVPVATSCGVGACARMGVSACIQGAVQAGCTPATPAADDTTCDGIDDDCNGLLDDGYVATTSTCKIAGCQAEGRVRCVNGVLSDDCASAGVCEAETDCGDGIDNDYDGAVDCVDTDCGTFAACAPPNDPTVVAPELDPSAAATFHDVVSFITGGANPIQRDFISAGVTPEQTAHVEGHVRARDGSALAGVVVSVVGHPELGSTRTRVDGNFNIVVLGGTPLRLRFERSGYVSVDRGADPVWRGSQHLDEIVLTPLASESTSIDTSGAASVYQVARGRLETDRDGARQATLLFPPSIEAQTQAIGGVVSQAALSVRVTELTVGPAGSHALPGPLPGSSAFLYAANVVADEALASEVDLSQPVPLYAENFLNLPVGTVLPAGAYDSAAGRFKPAGSGIVLAVLSVQIGSAELDTNADGMADSPSALAALGIGDAERGALAGLYAPGQKLMRVPLSKLGTWDVSPGPGPIAHAVVPPRTNIPATVAPRHAADVDVPVAGTEFSLHYSSDRVLGFGAMRHLDIDLGVPAGLPTQPHHVRLSIMPSTGGVQHYRWLVPGAPARASDFISDALPASRVLGWNWSGLDLAGRMVQGAYNVEVTTSYEYPCDYRAADRFGQYATGGVLPLMAAAGVSGTEVAGVSGVDRGTCLVPRRQSFRVEQWDQRGVGLGGFSLSAHHISLPDGSVLFGGGGRSTSKLSPVSRTLADPLAAQQPPFNAVSLDRAAIWATGAIRAGSDGSLYIVGAGPYLHRIGSDGLVTTLAGGNPSGCATRAIVAGSPALAVSSPVCGFNDLAILPDGDIVATDQGRIVRIDIATRTIAQLNQGAGAFTPDGADIASATLEAPSAVATDASGRIFFSDCGSHSLVRMIDESGHLSTVAGSGNTGDTLVREKVDARSISFGCVPNGALEVDGHANVFFAVEGGNRSVLQVDSAGRVVMLGGYDSCSSPGCQGHPAGLELDRNGNVYVAQSGEASVARYTSGDTRGWNFTTHDEAIEAVYGNPGELNDPRCNRPAGTPTSEFFVGTRADAVTGMAISPDGSLYVTERCHAFTSPGRETTAPDVGYLRARRLDPAAERVLSSPDGALYYLFDARGRHLETRNASTNGLVYSFDYDSSGRLQAIADSDGNTTTIMRDGSGGPSAIVAPFGQQTTLHLNANGYLDAVRPDPNHPAYGMQYVDARGLLETFATPRGTATQFGYDALGVLASTTDALDVTRGYMQATGASTRTSIQTGPSGTTTVSQQRDDDGQETLIAMHPDGTATAVSARNAQQKTVALSDGTTFQQTTAEDPQWGAGAPVVSTAVVLPSGIRQQVTTSRTSDSNPTAGPTSATVIRQQKNVNGATWNTTTDLVAGTRTTISPQGRITRLTKDSAGRLTTIERGGRSPVQLSYDNRGRLASVVSADGSAARTTTLTYASSTGYLESTIDGAGATTYRRDALGRVVQFSRPDGTTVEVDYDANGNIIAITPPDRSEHLMSYTPADALAEYAPPRVTQATQTVYEYNADRKLRRVVLPDGRLIEKTYTADGKLATMSTPLGTSTYTYNLPTGGLRMISDSAGATLSFGSDGLLPNLTVWGGGQTAVRGWVERTYDAEFRVASLDVNGGTIVDYQRDADGLITGAGPMQVIRHAENGDISATKLGEIATVEQRNPLGELSSYEAIYQMKQLYTEEIVSRDAIGRITSRIEVIAGTATNYGYQYDAVGRLSDVTVGGITARHYEYDANGNRTSRSTPGAAENCTYDAQDRLISCGDTQYVYNQAGQLSSRTRGAVSSTTYDYDVTGNLRKVVLADGRVIEYDIDPYERRIAKRINGARQWGLLYDNQLEPVAQLDAHNAVTSAFIYATREHVPDYMVKQGELYRLVVDHLGSVKLVVNAATGIVAQSLDYDEFGSVLADTNPGFQPFGFAGGLYDADTGLVRFGARDYDAGTGRWTAKDPLGFAGGDTNLYVYVGGDPIDRIDPTGENWVVYVGTCIALAYGAWKVYSEIKDMSDEWGNVAVCREQTLDENSPNFGEGCSAEELEAIKQTKEAILEGQKFNAPRTGVPKPPDWK
jgi:RHS repeat-associated protein